MDWYVVVKTINGCRYRYRQKTWREGKRVRTRSEYIGPADGASKARDLSGATTLTLPFPKTSRTRDSAFDSKVTAAALHALTDTDALSEAWEHGWSANRRGKNLVHKNERVVGLLSTLKVLMTDETSGAYYSPNLDVVNIPPARCFRDKDRQTATQAYHVVLFHELVHWTMDKRRLGRDVSDYAKEELVAELGAIMLMNYFRLEVGNIARHAKYFQTWLSRTDDRKAALRHAKKEAERAVKYILKRGKIDR
jgi:antirestriction protein ArdC